MTNTIEKIHADLHRFFRNNSTLPAGFRKEALHKLKGAILRHEEDLYDAMRKDLNKSREETWLTEIYVTLAEIDEALRHVEGWAAKSKRRTPAFFFPATSWVVPAPLGVSFIMSPWNYPFFLALGPLIGAISAGCCALLRPSEQVPSVSQVIKKIMEEAFQGEGYACVLGGRDMADKLLALPWDHIFFTGSTGVGKKVMKAAAEYLTPVTLELGGKSPVIVHREAKVNLAARRLAWGKIINAGQTCVAPDYAWIHEDIYDDFLEALRREFERMLGENPLKSEDYVRIINDHHMQRLTGYISANKVLSGGRADFAKRLIEPTLLEAPAFDSPVMQEEIFGPVLPVFRYSDIHEPLDFIRSRPHPLALYLFTEDKEITDGLLTVIPFGGGMVNDVVMQVGSPDLPFGGMGNSGMGSYHGKAGFAAFTHFKGVMRRGTWAELPVRFPPYKEKWINLVRKLSRFLR